MKILAINDHPYAGGAAQLFLRTNSILKDAGHEVFEITGETDFSIREITGEYETDCGREKRNDERLLDVYKNLQRRNIPIVSKYSSYVVNNIRHLTYPALARYLKYSLSSKQFDIAHIHNLHGSLSTEVFPIISSFNVPVVYQINDYYFFCNTYFAYNKKTDKPCKKCIRGNAFWAFYYNCFQYFCFGDGNSFIEAVRRYFLKMKNPWKSIDSFVVTGDKASELLVEFGIDKDRIYKSKNPMMMKDFDVPVTMGNRFVFYSTFHTLKGTDIFLKALEFVDEGVEIGYFVLGTSQDYINRLVKICEQRNINLHCDTVIDWRSGLREIIAGAYSVIIPSKWWVTSENVVYEGMLLGKAMIVGNSGGNAELVRDGETALLYDANKPRELAERINILNKNRVLGDKIGNNAYREARKLFSEDIFLTNLVEIYNKTISRERRDVTLP